MVEDAGGGGHNDDAEPTGGEQQVDPGLDLVNTDVVPRGDDAGLVETAVELHDDLAGAVVVNDLELADVAWDEGSAFATGRNDEGERKGGDVVLVVNASPMGDGNALFGYWGRVNLPKR